ncbi:MAG: acyl-CoA reductase [Planctomycetota bacterium]
MTDILARACRRFTDPADPVRRRAERDLPAVSGFSREMVRETLDIVFRSWTARTLAPLVPRVPWRTPAGEPPLLVHILPGNVFPASLFSLLSGLAAGAVNLAKASARDPVMPALFSRAVAEADPALGRRLAVARWERGEMDDLVFRSADAVVVHGDDASVAAVRRRVPRGIPFLGFGHRVGVAIVTKDNIRLETARRAARDISLYDQEGCFSPHAVYVEGGFRETLAFARLLATALAAFHRRIPRGRVSPGEAVSVHAGRAGHMARGGRVFAGDGVSWTVVASADSRFGETCRQRFIVVRPIRRLAELPRALAGWKNQLSSAGMAVSPSRVAGTAVILAGCGIRRICPLGEMQTPSVREYLRAGMSFPIDSPVGPCHHSTFRGTHLSGGEP